MNDLKVGDKIYCKNWHDLKATALHLSSLGYGVCIVGFADMSENVLTITALPDETEADNDERSGD